MTCTQIFFTIKYLLIIIIKIKEDNNNNNDDDDNTIMPAQAILVLLLTLMILNLILILITDIITDIFRSSDSRFMIYDSQDSQILFSQYLLYSRYSTVFSVFYCILGILLYSRFRFSSSLIVCLNLSGWCILLARTIYQDLYSRIPSFYLLLY